MSSKFKPGDRVVLKDAIDYFREESIYLLVGTIVGDDENYGYDFMVQIPDRVNYYYVYKNEIEHEQIYNSPLYKALK